MNFIKKKALLLTVIIPFVIAGCSSNQSGGGNMAGGMVTPSVEAVQAQFGTLPLEERLSGIVRAANQVEIYPRINAPIESILVENGDFVEQGQPLIRLTDREYRERLQQSEASLRVTLARARQVETRLNELRSQFQRQARLAAQNLISEVDYESIKAQVESAEADYELALAQVDQARSSLSEQQDILTRTVISAPISGTVGQRNAEVGMQATTNTRLFTIGDLTTTRVQINLTESMLRYISPGQTAQISSETIGDTLLYGKISRISPFLSQGSFSTEAEIDISNESGLLMSGMFVTVDILYGESERATIIPLSALYRNPRSGEEGVYVATRFGLETEPITEVDADNPPPLSDATELEFRSIQVIARGREAAGVVGIQSGEWVVTVGQSMMVGSRDNRARIRAVSWDRILAMQRTQPQDLLKEIMSKEFTGNFNGQGN